MDRRVSRKGGEDGTSRSPGQVFQLEKADEEDGKQSVSDESENAAEEEDVLWEQQPDAGDSRRGYASIRNLTFHVADEQGVLLLAGRVQVRKRHSDVAQNELRKLAPGIGSHQIMPFAGTLSGVTDPAPDASRNPAILDMW